MYTLIEEEMARLRDEGRRRGRREGHREGSRTLLERQVAKKFGADAAGQLSGLTRLEDLLADEAKAFLPFALGH